MTDCLIDREKDKYERMWAVSNYSKHSPGLAVASTAYKELGMSLGNTLLDFGCGQCLAVDWFFEHGVIAQGIDLVPLRNDVIEACLWNLPVMAPADWAFSSDVLEHIPTDKVDDVLGGIRRLSVCGAFLQIATRPDVMGRLIGETLHLTVMPREWWVSKLEEHWNDVRVGPCDDRQFWAVCK